MSTAQARMILFSVVALSYAVVLPLGWMVGITVDYHSIGILLASFAPPVVAGVLYAIYRRMEPLRVALETSFCGALLTVPIGLLTYVAMRLNFPLADETLARMDAALGFDWHAFVRFVDGHSGLAAALGVAYNSFSFQLVAVPILLVICGQQIRAYAMVTTFAFLCFAACAISIPYPALGAYASYDVAAESLVNINAHFGFAFLEEFNAVRTAPDFVFSLATMQGILTFPSVHAAVAALCAWAMWDTRLLRYPFLVLNGLMTVSAVSHASHYFVGLIAGVGLAGATIAVVMALFRLGTPVQEKNATVISAA